VLNNTGHNLRKSPNNSGADDDDNNNNILSLSLHYNGEIGRNESYETRQITSYC